MSPSRTRQQFVRARPRAEVVTAVLVAVTIIGGTAALVWLLRPGTPGIPGGGGLLSRQPRMTILFLLTAVALAMAIARVRRGRRLRARLGERGSILAASSAVIVLAIAGGIFWPGGVLRHWPKRPKIADTPVTNSIPASPTTKAAVSTTPTTATSTASSAPPTTSG
jgi:hypothetical protein